MNNKIVLGVIIVLLAAGVYFSGIWQLGGMMAYGFYLEPNGAVYIDNSDCLRIPFQKNTEELYTQAQLTEWKVNLGRWGTPYTEYLIPDDMYDMDQIKSGRVEGTFSCHTACPYPQPAKGLSEFDQHFSKSGRQFIITIPDIACPPIVDCDSARGFMVTGEFVLCKTDQPQPECYTASDCEGNAHPATLGHWECQNGNCVWVEGQPPEEPGCCGIPWWIWVLVVILILLLGLWWWKFK